MPNPHAFYRFQNTWNAGFYPDNVVISNLLNEVYLFMGTWVPANAIGMTFSELKLEVKSIVAGYNSPTRLGGFVVTTQIIPDSPNYEFNINILNEDLASVDSNQVLVINGFFNPTNKIVVSAVVYSFTPGSYIGTFSKAKIKIEDEVANALQIVNQNGSAFFPKTYLYNHGTGIATSGLARGSDWTLDANGESTQVPALTLPTTNARTFTMPTLTPDERFIVSFMESIIGTSLSDISYLSIQDTYNSMDAPDGWTKSWAYNSVTYERIQIGFEGPNGRSFAMVGRLDADWLWQRFVVNDATTSGIPNFLTTYIATAPLPYPTDGSAYYVYFSEWFDFDFVEFTSGCYESNEFYPMPAIPGDTLQFNIPISSGNLIGLESVSVGLFDENGGFVQKIGDAIQDTTQCCTQYQASISRTATQWNEIIDIWNGYVADPATHKIGLVWLDSANPTAMREFWYDLTTELTYLDLTAIFEGFSNAQNLFEVTTIIDPIVGPIVSIVYTPYGYDCTNSEGLTCYIQLSEIPTSLIQGWEMQITGGYVTTFNNQFYASVIIPSVATNCYRLGLYNLPGEVSTTCELTFEYIVDSPESYVDEINSYSPKWLAFALYNGTELSQIHELQIPSTDPPNTGFDLAQIIDFANSIPGMVATYDEITAYLTYNWTVTVPCNQDFSFRNLILNEDNSIINLLFATETQQCTCEVIDPNAYSLYSLSNSINIDASDCFSTIIEFWADANSIAQGFLYNNDWKQRIRLGINGGGAKPIIEENVYRQSNGVHRRPQNKQDLSIDLHTDYIDFETQCALVDATRHPYFVWNNQSIFVNGDVEVATTQDFTTQSSFETLAQVKFQALVQGFQPKNSSCLTC